MTNLFEMFSSALPEEMKKQEEELKRKKEEAKKKAKSKKTKPKEPTIPEKEKKQVYLPVTVFYARERIVLENNEIEYVERINEDSNEEDNDSKEGVEKETNNADFVEGVYKPNISLRMVVPLEIIEEGKISLEDARALLQEEFPELSKERCTIDYCKDSGSLYPIVKAANKGAISKTNKCLEDSTIQTYVGVIKFKSNNPYEKIKGFKFDTDVFDMDRARKMLDIVCSILSFSNNCQVRWEFEGFGQGHYLDSHLPIYNSYKNYKNSYVGIIEFDLNCPSKELKKFRFNTKTSSEKEAINILNKLCYTLAQSNNSRVKWKFDYLSI